MNTLLGLSCVIAAFLVLASLLAIFSLVGQVVALEASLDEARRRAESSREDDAAVLARVERLGLGISLGGPSLAPFSRN